MTDQAPIAAPTPPAGTASVVRVEADGEVARLTMDSPHNRNALSTAMIDQLLAAINEASADERIRVIVISHTGNVFCSGADLKETTAAFSAGTIPAANMGAVLAAIWDCPKPVVVRIGGAARAGGLGIIAAADIAVAATSATFAFSEVRIGVIPAVISSTVLRRISPRAAAELYLTADTFDAARAENIGLVTKCVADDRLDSAVGGYVASLLKGAPRAIAAAKRLSRRQPGESITDDLRHLTDVSVRFFTSAEGREGINAYLQKRDPNWIARQ